MPRQITQITTEPCGRGWWTIFADGLEVGVIHQLIEHEFKSYVSRVKSQKFWVSDPADTLDEAVAELRRVFIAMDVEWDEVNGWWAASPHT